MPAGTSQPTDMYIAALSSRNGRGVTVIHVCRGLNDLCKGVCDRLAQAGFGAAVTFFHHGMTTK